ncbi:MAG: c-type cytochrome [Spirochaetia bacterium]|nr:c-type cytochrome [Spirochaetia bacterium]
MKKMIKLLAIAIMALAMNFCGEGKKDSAEDAGAEPENPGKVVYEQYCLTCHGISGEGDGPGGKSLNPKPRNFKSEQFKFGDSLEAVMNTVTNGSPKAPTMVPFKGTLTPEQIKAVSEHVRTLAGKQ